MVVAPFLALVRKALTVSMLSVLRVLAVLPIVRVLTVDPHRVAPVFLLGRDLAVD